MEKQLEQVAAFREAFGQYIGDRPERPDEDTWMLDTGLILEEAAEAARAIAEGEIGDVAKELVDLLYVTLGAVISHGLTEQIASVFDQVHQNNMSKLGPDGTVTYDPRSGKVLKPPYWVPLNVKDLLSD